MLKIEPKSDTPGVIIDPTRDIFEIYGKSLPEDATEFYEPVLEYIRAYAENPNKETNFVINFEYYNSASVRQIIAILTLLEALHKKGKTVKVQWMYDEGDEIMRENGEEFQETVDIPFEIKSFNFDY